MRTTGTPALPEDSLDQLGIAAWPEFSQPLMMLTSALSHLLSLWEHFMTPLSSLHSSSVCHLGVKIQRGSYGMRVLLLQTGERQTVCLLFLQDSHQSQSLKPM